MYRRDNAPFDNSDAGIPAGSTCCSLDDVEDAKEASRRLGINTMSSISQ